MGQYSHRYGQIERKPDETLQKKCRKITDDFTEADTELIAAGFPLYKGGKVTDYVADKADAWLRQHARQEPRIVVSISKPTDAELQRRQRLQ